MLVIAGKKLLGCRNLRGFLWVRWNVLKGLTVVRKCCCSYDLSWLGFRNVEPKSWTTKTCCGKDLKLLLWWQPSECFRGLEFPRNGLEVLTWGGRQQEGAEFKECGRTGLVRLSEVACQPTLDWQSWELSWKASIGPSRDSTNRPWATAATLDSSAVVPSDRRCIHLWLL